MKTGYPSHMSIADLSNSINSTHSHINIKEFCILLLRACSLKWSDFKVGNSQIFFRKDKIEMCLAKLRNSKEVQERIDLLITLRKRFKKAIKCALGCARFYTVIGKRSRENDMELDMESEATPRKKIRRNKNCAQSLPTATEVTADFVNLDEFSTTLPGTSKHTWTTIAIQSCDSTVEDQLRTLLRQAEDKNKILSVDYLQLQKQNVQLSTKLQKLEKENEKLICENKKFRKDFQYISLEHDYQLPQ